MTTNISRFVFIFALSIIIYACKKDDEPYPIKYEAVDLVTVIHNDTRKGIELELQRSDKSEKYRMQAPQYIDTTIPCGQRVLASYEAELSDTAKRPMPILLTGMAMIPFDTIRTKPIKEIESLPSPQLSILSCWKSGNFINFQVELQYDGNSRSFSMIADETTIGKNQLDCFLYNTGESVSENFIDTRNYGSFFVGDILSDDLPNIIRIYTNGIADKNSFIDIVIDSH